MSPEGCDSGDKSDNGKEGWFLGNQKCGPSKCSDDDQWNLRVAEALQLRTEKEIAMRISKMHHHAIRKLRSELHEAK